MTATLLKGLALSLLFVGVVVVFRALPEEWKSAVEGASTVVLVGVTAAYVLLTARLVQVQQNSPANLLSEQAVAGLARILTEKQSLWGVTHAFPLDLTKPPSDLEQAALDFEVQAKRIEGFQLQVPAHFGGLTLNLTRAMWKMIAHLTAFNFSVAQELERAESSSQDPQWAEIKKAYEMTTEEGPEGDRWETWQEFIAGNLAREVAAAYEALHDAVRTRTFDQWAKQLGSSAGRGQ